MRVQIAQRHCDVPEPIRDRARSRIERLVRYDSRLARAEVVFEEEKHLKKVEAILSVDRDEPVVARAEADEYRAAVDRLVDKLSRILRKRRSQRRDHQARPLKEVASLGE